MTSELPSQHNSAVSRRRWQFSVRASLIGLLILSVFFAIAAQFPRQLAFVVLMVFPLTVAAALRVPFILWGIVPADRFCAERSAKHSRITNVFQRLMCLLGLRQPDNDPSLVAGFATAVISSFTLVGLWPAIREIGLLIAVSSTQSLGETWQYASRTISDTFSRGSYWLRLWRWEMWSLGRWWLLFGAIVVIWLTVSSPLRRWLKTDRALNTLARFLAFAPWFIVLEVAFLVGVYIQSPTVVPEPSTGFVVGIFSWDLWRWDCWLDRGWLIRGALPTFVVGGVFFSSVLRWPWLVAGFAALILIPIALVLSVGCTVAYQRGFPAFF